MVHSVGDCVVRKHALLQEYHSVLKIIHYIVTYFSKLTKFLDVILSFQLTSMNESRSIDHCVVNFIVINSCAVQFVFFVIPRLFLLSSSICALQKTLWWQMYISLWNSSWITILVGIIIKGTFYWTYWQRSFELACGFELRIYHCVHVVLENVCTQSFISLYWRIRHRISTALSDLETITLYGGKFSALNSWIK